MKFTAVIVAAGSGNRMGSGIPKQYLKIDGEPIIVKTVRAFRVNKNVDGIFVVVNKDYKEYCRNLLEAGGLKTEIVIGGKERQDSVYAALKELKRRGTDPGRCVLIHDGARPFVTGRIIDDVAAAVAETGAAVPVVPVRDSIRRKDGNLNRNGLYAAQTPQGFTLDLVFEAYERAYAEGITGTDDASLVDRLGREIRMIDGDYGNIKITTKDDLPVSLRIGTGFDAHAFAEGRKLVLGGVVIPCNRGLHGHSDADVMVHAVMDAMLGAAAMGDIGRYFPDSEETYKGISSLKLLKKTDEIIKKEGYEISNLDITLIAQKPNISEYTEEMTSNIAQVLNISKRQLNIKGTTTEKLGFIGREEGIACQASCILKYKGEEPE